MADITGVYGLSFLIILANVVIYRIIRGMVRKEAAAYPAASAGLLLLLLVITLGYGFHRLKTPEQGEVLKVALTQGNIPQDVKWDPAYQERTVATYEKLSRQSSAGARSRGLAGKRRPLLLSERSQYAARIKSLAAELKNLHDSRQPRL